MAVALTKNVLVRRVAAAGNNQFWYEDPNVAAGTLVAISVTTSAASGLDTTDQLECFEAYQKAMVVNGSIFKVADFANTKLQLSAALTNPPAQGDTLTQATASAVMVVDFVNSAKTAIYGYVTTGVLNFSTTGDIVSNEANASVTPSVFTPQSVVSTKPHFYDWTTYPDTINPDGSTRSYGVMPNKGYLGKLYRGRAVLSGNPEAPFQWYMTRQSHLFDFAYGANDSQSAVAGTNSDAGEVGDYVRALIPYKDDYLIFGCASSMWVMRGDPTAGGSLDEISLTTGIFGSRAYAWDDKDNLYFFGTGGFYVIPSGLGPPVNLSAEVLPSIVSDLGIQESTQRVSLAYDRINLGIKIAVTTLADGTNLNYWYDIRTGGFFPETYPEETAVYSIIYYASDTVAHRALLVGGKDGYIRNELTTAKDDDIGATDEAIASYVTLGPIKLGPNEDVEGKIMSMTFTTATGTDSLAYSVYVGDSAEQVLDQEAAASTPHLTGTVPTPNRISKIRIKCRGIYALVKIENITASETWAIENISIQFEAAGSR